MKSCQVPIVLALLCLSVPTDAADDPDAAQLALKFGEAQAENLETLKQFSWKARTEVRMDGESKIVALDYVRFDSEGEIERTNLSTESSIEKKRGFRGRKQKAALDDVAALLEDSLSLLASYILMTKGQLVDFYEKASLTPGTDAMEGTTEVNAQNVTTKGDDLTVWVDADTGLNRKLEFQAPLGEDLTVTGEVNYRVLEEGPSTASKATLAIPAEKIEIVNERFEFAKQ